MDDARLVRALQRIAELQQDPQRCLRRHRPRWSIAESVSPSRCSITM